MLCLRDMIHSRLGPLSLLFLVLRYARAVGRMSTIQIIAISMTGCESQVSLALVPITTRKQISGQDENHGEGIVQANGRARLTLRIVKYAIPLNVLRLDIRM